MMTVKEASRLTGISIRTLQYYDKLGLLPAMRTESGYSCMTMQRWNVCSRFCCFGSWSFPCGTSAPFWTTRILTAARLCASKLSFSR